MKSSEKDINRLVLAAVLMAASAAVLITGGLVAEKKRVDMPAVEIIEAEDKTVTAADNLAETVYADGTIADTITVTEEVSAELMKLKGVGEKTAGKIIEYRAQSPFEKPEDIMNVKGIGEKKFEDIKDHICV